MDTRTRSASPNEPLTHKLPHTPPPQDKISAYYSLVFPHFTFYIQTLSVTIGRRCAPNPNAATTSTSEPIQVDVDLGALKSVSRLHAKIEYDQDEDRFVLAVIGRNGAWVDGVWSGSGTRAPLSERSQIQIASRTFHFVLPPPPPPEDTPSPSSQSSANRQRSPSVDITSISPPSSLHSHTPPPPVEHIKPPPSPEPQIVDTSPPPPKPRLLLASPQLPNSNSIGKSNKAAASKKRKKGDVEPPALPRPKPEDIPPKPPFTYAQLIYKAIKAIGEKATLQEICNWIMNAHEYYRYSDASWMSSVRHNLSSSKAFQKLERCGGDRGKGFFWKLDPEHSQVLEEQETKIAQSAAAGGSQGADGHVRRKKDKGAILEPPLKRSVKGDLKGTPLPPPLTSTPLVMKTSSPSTTVTAQTPSMSTITATSPTPGKATPSTTTPATTGVFAYSTTHHAQTTTIPQSSTATSGYTAAPLSAPNPYAAWTMHPMSSMNGATHTLPTPATTAPTSPAPVHSPSALPAQSPPPPVPPAAAQTSGQIVPDVCLPIVLGPIPPTHPDYLPTHPNNSAKEGYMILHERTLILDPGVFGELTKETLEGLEKRGMIAALQVLKEHMVKVLKQRRAKGRNKAKRMRGPGKKAGDSTNPLGPPLTTAPLEQKLVPGPAVNMTLPAGPSPPPPLPVTALVPDPVPMDIGGGMPVDAGSPIVIIDDSDDDGPAAKRRKVDEILIV